MSGGYEQRVAAGRAARDAGHLAEADRCYRVAAEAAGSDLQRAHALRHVSDIASDRGRFAAALAASQDALALYQGLPQVTPLDLGNAQRVVARALGGLGKADQSAAAWREARRLYLVAGIADGVEECDRYLA